MKAGLGVVRKENEDLKAILDKEEQQVREEMGGIKTWKVEHEKASATEKQPKNMKM